MAFTFLYLLSWLGLVVNFSFGVLCVASGLQYLAELIEEYSVKSKRILTYMIWCIVAIHTVLWLVDGIPWYMSVLGISAHLCFCMLMRTFPFFSLVSPLFIIGCVLWAVSQVLAFQFFTQNWFPFTDILAYYTICLWLVPVLLFLSLSANDNALPVIGSGGVVSMDDSNIILTRKSGFLQVMDWFKQLLSAPRGSKSR